MSDTVKFDADKCVNNFASAVGNGAKMTEHFVAAINYVIAERDTTVITRLYQRTKARKDDKIAGLILSTFGKVFVGAKATKKNGKLVGIKIAGAALSNAAVRALHELNADSASMRGPKFAKAFRADKETPAFDAQKAAERFVKAHPTSNELEAMIAALQAKRSEVKPNEAVVDTRAVEAPQVAYGAQYEAPHAPTLHFAAE